MHCVDFQVMQLRVCVCVRVCEQIGCRTITLRPQFFTDFHHILRAARKYGWFDANCSWDKPEVGFWILEVYKFRLQQFFAFAGWLTDWLTEWWIDWSLWSDVKFCFVGCWRVVPARIYELRNITRNENLAASLVCRSHGDPAPDMKFRKMGSPHEFNASNVRHDTRHGTGSLGHKVNGSFGSSFTSGSPGHRFDPVWDPSLSGFRKMPKMMQILLFGAGYKYSYLLTYLVEYSSTR